MSFNAKSILIIAAIGVILVLGYGLMRGSVYLIPVEGNGALGGLYMFVMIVVGLAIPYWALKLLLHQQHLKDPQERELTLKDLPKDKDQLKNNF